MKITLGFSTCPNDTFIFDALVHHKIDVEGLEFDVVLYDVAQLNKWALEGKLDVTKVSYNAFTYCVKDYVLLDSGSALGFNCGPLLIKKSDVILNSESRIGIPGLYTTANMLFSLAFPNNNNKEEFLFSEIEDAILTNKIDAGIIIHENRFTYKKKGLEKVKDLGEFWEEETQLPIPLGGIVVKRDIDLEIQQKIERVIKRSVEYALQNPHSSYKYVSYNADSLEKGIIEAHINLYVNTYSVSLSDKGRKAIEILFDNAGIKCQNIFVGQ